MQLKFPSTLRALTILVLCVAGIPLNGFAQVQTPLMISRSQAGLNAGTVVAVYPGGSRVYLGESYYTKADRLCLTVFTVNDKGQTVGAARHYRDSALPLVVNARTSITAIFTDARLHKLYLAYILDGSGAGDEKRFVSVYDLDNNGEPVGQPHSYVSGNPNRSILGLAVHPRLNVLYMVGWGGTAVYAYQLDAKGEPQGDPKVFSIGGQGKYQVKVSPDGKRLYLGTYPDLLEVVDLDENGFRTGTPQTFKAGTEARYLTFGYSPQALFLVQKTPDGDRLAVWPLDAQGDPIGEPKVQGDIPVSAIAVDVANSTLWVGADDTFKDAFSGKSIVQGVRPESFPINKDGSLGTSNNSSPVGFRQWGVALAADNGHVALLTTDMPGGVLGSRVKDYRLRITVQSAQSAAAGATAKMAFALSVGSSPAQSLG
ncbi:MAG: hypothetical protein ABI210_13190, partial [Abditibacteriaceae bacterium]